MAHGIHFDDQKVEIAVGSGGPSDPRTVEDNATDPPAILLQDFTLDSLGDL
jgi:hypothetical protein